MNHTKTDVVIVGGGLAGIVAALELLNYGKKVVLLERDIKDNFGGLAKLSFGGMFFVNTPNQRNFGVKDNPDLAFKDWCSFAEFEKDAHWAKKSAEQYVNLCTPEVHDWLKKEGISFFPVVHWVERGLLKPGNSVPRFHMVWGTGHWLAVRLAHNLVNHPKAKSHLDLRFRHCVDDISMNNGHATGVTGKDEATGEEFEVLANNVVVATGGVSGNLEKVREYWYKDWGTPPKVILNGSHKYADGKMHDAVDNLGGHLTHMDKYWHYAASIHHPKPQMPNHGLSLVPPKSAIWLNYQGQRFGPMPLISAYDTRYLVEQICQQEKKYSWQVMNLKIAYREFAISGSEHNAAIRDKKIFQFLKTILFGNKKLVNEMIRDCEDIVTANSIEELAEKMNALTGENDVDVQLLRNSIQDYDAAIDRGQKYHNDEQLRRLTHLRQYRGDRIRTCKFQKIFDKKAMPLIAIREFILSRKSLGGIQTDLDSRILAKDEKTPIPGLYAVGEVSGFGGGGMHGLRALEGTFLGGCVLNGRLAAKAIAKK